MKLKVLFFLIICLQKAICQIYEPIKILKTPNGAVPNYIQFSPNGKQIAGIFSDDMVAVFDIDSELQSDFFHSRTNNICYSPNGKLLLLTEPFRNYDFGNSNPNLVYSPMVYDLEKHKYKKVSAKNSKYHSYNIINVAFSNDSQYFMSRDKEDWSIYLWDAVNGNFIKKIGEHNISQLYEVCNACNSLQTTKYVEENRLICRNNLKKTDFRLNNDGELKAICQKEKIEITGKNIKSKYLYGTQGDEFKNAFFTKNNQYLICSNNGDIIFWDIIKGNIIKKISSNKIINSLSVSEDEKYIATASEDSFIRIWNLPEVINNNIENNTNTTNYLPKIYAVIVGIADYEGTVNDLTYCVDDAQKVYDFLKSPYGGNVPDSQIKFFSDSKATSDNILRETNQLFSKAKDNDLIIFYFSGHGGVGYFYGYDGNIEHESVRNIFMSSKAQRKLCIADACHSGSWDKARKELVLKGNQMTPEQMTQMYYNSLTNSGTGLALFMSCQGLETSIDDRGLKQGLFTYYYLKGLEGAADSNYDKIITIQELYDYVKIQVSKRARNDFGSSQTPKLGGVFDHDIPVGVVR